MSETSGVTKNEGIQKLLEAEKEATKIVDEARQRKLHLCCISRSVLDVNDMLR